MAEHRVTSFILLYVSVTDSENATNRTNALFGAATQPQRLRPVAPNGAIGRPLNILRQTPARFFNFEAD